MTYYSDYESSTATTAWTSSDTTYYYRASEERQTDSPPPRVSQEQARRLRQQERDRQSHEDFVREEVEDAARLLRQRESDALSVLPEEDDDHFVDHENRFMIDGHEGEDSCYFDRCGIDETSYKD
jgi:hypothetical protein